MASQSNNILEINKVCKFCAVSQPISFYSGKNKSTCKVCIKKRNAIAVKKYRKINGGNKIYKQKINLRMREYRLKNKDKISKQSSFWNRKKVYGITQEEISYIINQQNSLCAICGCGVHLGKYGYSIDHDHATGKIRGILCMPYNKGLGNFKDNEISLKNAINYLLKSRMV